MSVAEQGLVADADVTRGAFTLRAAVTRRPRGGARRARARTAPGKSTLLARDRRADAAVRRPDQPRTGSSSTTPTAGTFVEAADRPVGFVFQNYRLFPHLSVLDNVAFSPRARGLGRVQARAVAAGRGWGGWAWPTSPAAGPRDLSGGQAQRVALGRALAGDPALLLLDEPLSALDARTRLDVQTELKRHLADFAGPCLLVTHDPLEALVLADRLLVLEHGRVVQEGTPARGRPAPGHRVRRPAGRAEPVRRHRRRCPRRARGRRRRSSCPTTTSAARCWWRCARRPSWSARTSPTSRACATPGRRRSPG